MVCQLWITLKSYKQISNKCKPGWVKLLHLRTSNALKPIVIVTHSLNVSEIMSKMYQNIITQCDLDSAPFRCEWCEKPMTEEDHHFCDICDDCRDENEID